jgi:hypothetical protein
VKFSRLKRAVTGVTVAGVALGAGTNFGGCGAELCSGKNSCSLQVGSQTTDALPQLEELVEQIAKGERRRMEK